jgi:L-rhamnose mutarotase
MDRKAFLLRVKLGQQENYRQIHKDIWPELIAAAGKAGIRNHTGFMHGQAVFLYLEADDFEKAWRELLKDPVKAKWDQRMAPLFESLPGLKEGESSVVLEEVFHFD